MSHVENNRPSRTEMMNWIKGFTKWPHRQTGTKEGRESAGYVRDTFKDLGLEAVEIESVPSVCRNTSLCELIIDGKAIECFHSNGTNRKAELGELNTEIVDKELIYVGTGTDDDFENLNLTGKIVVCDVFFNKHNPKAFAEQFDDAMVYDPEDKLSRQLNTYNIFMPTNWPSSYLKARNAGAAGIVGILHNFMDCNYFHEDFTDIVDIDGHMELPAVWVSKQDGLKLAELIRHEKFVTGSMRVKTTYEKKSALNVKGVIKGATDDIVVVHSHHDATCKGAVQDASGMSVVFALAKYFSSLPKERIKTTMMFLSTDSHYTDYEGHVGFINKRKENGENLIIDFAIEHIGKAMEMGEDNEIILYDESESRWMYVTDVDGFPEIAFEAVKKYNLEKTMVLPVDFQPESAYKSGDVCSDAYDFNAREIPVVSIISTPMYLFHNSDDIEKVYQDDLEPVAEMYIELIEKAWEIYEEKQLEEK